MRNMRSSLLVLLGLVSLSACSTSTTGPQSFDTGLDPSRTAVSLSVEETRAVCEQLSDETQARFDHIRQLICLSVAAYADTEQSCRSGYDQCIARLEGAVTFSCDPTGRLTPGEDLPVCAGVTVDQIEHGLTVYLNSTTTMTAASLCAMPVSQRMGFGDLSHFGASESDIAGYNCAVNTTLHPTVLCDGAACFSI